MRRAVAAAICGVLLAWLTTAGRADQLRSLPHGGIERSYVVHLPAAPPAEGPLALVVVLHGGGGNADNIARQSGFNAESDRHGFIVAYPNGTDRRRPLLNARGRPGLLTWNAGLCCGFAMENRIDDVGFVRAMIAELGGAYPIDRRRIFAAGMSNGGMMAYRLACEASDLFAAVGVVAGALTVRACTPAAPVSLIHIHGAADENVPIGGGVGRRSPTRTSYPALTASIAAWVDANRCTQPPRQTRAPSGVQTLEYLDCRGGSAITLHVIAGGGHSWPGGQRLLATLDAPSAALAATAAIWQFFAAHPRR
ncbi:MAG: polyhydroxybutyrate depolymerase [Alphaproteobacteria bacterium]|nr:polyhydroxybutyrate depolymerase [Alphaproteobacteria bacterium]